MFLDYLPDVLQQIAIASIILFASFKVGERKKTKEEDPNFRRLVVWNSILVGVLYAEAIFLEVFISEEDPPIIDDSGVTVPAESKTTQWLKGHNDFFWFFLAIHQSILLGIIFFELMSSSKRSKMIWFGAIPPAIQWLIGLFSENALAGAIAGLMFEMIAVVLLILYGIKSCLSKTKTRSSYGFFAMLFYFISVLPVFFIGTQMKSVHHALFLTIFFGALSFFCWGRTIVKTNAKDDGSFEFIPVKELIEVDVAVDSSKKTVINRSQGTTDPLRDLEETNDISKFSIDDDNSQHSDDKKD